MGSKVFWLESCPGGEIHDSKFFSHCKASSSLSCPTLRVLSYSLWNAEKVTELDSLGDFVSFEKRPFRCNLQNGRLSTSIFVCAMLRI